MSSSTSPAVPALAQCSCENLKAATTALGTLTKDQLLDVLEAVPQSYWPPRPTRQDKPELKARIFQALHSTNGTNVATAIFQVAGLHHWEDQLPGIHTWIQRCTSCGAKRERHRRHRRDIWPVWTYP